MKTFTLYETRNTIKTISTHTNRFSAIRALVNRFSGYSCLKIIDSDNNLITYKNAHLC